jgi:hypothetical protein
MNMDGQDVRVDFNTLTDARNPISYALMISSTQPMIFSVISPSSTISLSTSTNLFKPLRPISEKCRHDLIFAPLHFRQLEVTIFGDRPLNPWFWLYNLRKPGQLPNVRLGGERLVFVRIHAFC